MRRTVALLTACAAAALAASAPSALAVNATACQFDGSWTMSPGLKIQTIAATGLKLSGTANLTGCQGTGGPATGTMYLGGSTITLNGVAYRAPAPAAGGGTCGYPLALANFAGAPAIIRWDTGTVTVVDFGAQGPWAVAQYINSQPLSGVTLKTVALDPATNQPRSVFIPTTQYTGYSVTGVSATTSANQADCAGTGFTSAAVTGKLVLSSTA